MNPLIRIIADFNADRVPDILAAGNNFGTAPKSDPIAGLGSLPIGNGDHGYEVYPADKTGFRAPGEIREMEVISSPLGAVILLARNGLTPLPYLYQQSAE